MSYGAFFGPKEVGLGSGALREWRDVFWTNGGQLGPRVSDATLCGPKEFTWGPAKQDVGKPTHVSARNVSWPDDPRSATCRAAQDLDHIKIN